MHIQASASAEAPITPREERRGAQSTPPRGCGWGHAAGDIRAGAVGTGHLQPGGRPWREQEVCHPRGVSVPAGVTPIGDHPIWGSGCIRGAGGIG